MVETVYQVTSRTPEIEAYELGLLEAAQKLSDERLFGKRVVDPETGAVSFDRTFDPPPFQIAGMSPLEQQAAQMAAQGLGSYVPFLQQGASTIGSGVGLLADAAAPTLAQGQQFTQEAGRLAQQLREIPYQYQTAAGEGLLASAGTFNPALTQGFMNPFEDQVVQTVMQDIRDAGDVDQIEADARAVAAGAFGGARQGIVENEIEKNILREQARAAAGLRASGFDTARQAAQKAFEDTQQRRLLASQGIGNLGINFGQLSQGDIDQMRGIGVDLSNIAQNFGQIAQLGGNLGVQQAALGEQAQSLLGRDIALASQIGAQQRGLQQAGLDAARATQLARQNAPFEALAFQGDIIRGVPSSQQSIQTVTGGGGGSASPFQQLLGLGGALYTGGKALQGLGAFLP